ncbi:MAG: hypothetical protein WD355_09620 [Balneolaceae bacterium]
MKALPLVILALLTAAAGCRQSPPEHWSELIPDQIPFLIIPENESTVRDVLASPFMPVVEDVTTSALQLTEELIHGYEEQIIVRAVLLYPDTSNEWQTIWIADAPSGMLSEVASRYHKPFDQNRYQFRGTAINKIFLPDRTYYAAEIGEYTLFSEASLGIEELIRTHLGEQAQITVHDSQLAPGTFLLNTSRLDLLVELMAKVAYRPFVHEAFLGGGTVSLKATTYPDSDNLQWQLTGSMQISEQPSTLIRAAASPSRPFELDQYIPANSAAFAILSLEPRMVPPDSLEPVTELDRYLSGRPEEYREIAASLGDEIAFAAFAESGFLSDSEFLFLRKAEQPDELRSHLERLSESGHIQRSGSLYQLSSPLMGKLFGSELSPISDFYLGLHGDAVITARRNGLAQSVITDSERRSVMSYSDQYIGIREQLPDDLSSLLFVNSSLFTNYIQPWLDPQNRFDALSSTLDNFTISTTRENESSPLEITFSSFQRETEDIPYREEWLFSLNGAEISGVPAHANIGGSARDEIVFSTRSGSVYAVAADGTVVAQMSTGEDRPVGPPVIYDWYGNNQNIIMQAAGNKIYAWNISGDLLPNFPVQVSEEITTPLQVADVSRNGVAEMIVATADRNLYILNARGEPISGWPQATNAVIRSKPAVGEYRGSLAILAFAENSLHGWNVNGVRRDGFPLFIDSQFNGSPSVYHEHILGAASDGTLYSFGNEPLFADSLVASVTGDSLITQGLNVANSSLNTTPSVHNLMLRVDGELIREDLVLLQSSNGSLFLFNLDGTLRFTENMGQPSAEESPPLITDINSDGRSNLVALAGFGRLYAWDILSGERNYDIPTTGITFPLIHDLTRDGRMELIGNSREGLRAWSILR